MALLNSSEEETRNISKVSRTNCIGFFDQTVLSVLNDRFTHFFAIWLASVWSSEPQNRNRKF